MARLSRLVAVAVLLGGATVSMSACTHSSVTPATPSPTGVVVSETPSPSPTPTALTDDELLALIPEEARREDFFGASAFVEFFIDLYPGLFTDPPETRVFEALSMGGCVFCETNLSASANTAEVGAHSEGGDFTFTGVLGQGGPSEDGFTYVSRRFSVTDTVTYLADGSIHDTQPGGTGVVAMKILFEDSVWHVYGVDFKYDDE